MKGATFLRAAVVLQDLAQYKEWSMERKPFQAPAITDETSLVEGTLISNGSGGGGNNIPT